MDCVGTTPCMAAEADCDPAQRWPPFELAPREPGLVASWMDGKRLPSARSVPPVEEVAAAAFSGESGLSLAFLCCCLAKPGLLRASLGGRGVGLSAMATICASFAREPARTRAHRRTRRGSSTPLTRPAPPHTT